MTVDYGALVLVVENLQKSGLILWVLVLCELAIGQEVLTIDSVVVLVGDRERAEVDARLGSEDAATETWLAFVQGDQVDSGVGIEPEASQHAFHITACNPIIN